MTSADTTKGTKSRRCSKHFFWSGIQELGELPLHLQGRLHAGKGGLGKAQAGFEQAVDLTQPLSVLDLSHAS